MVVFACGWAVFAGLMASALAQSTSPGPLAASHRKVDDQCGKCHSEQAGADDTRCLDCHKEARTSRWHWRHAQDSKKACASCHRDHRGRDFQMIRWTPPKDFDHATTGYPLRGAHAAQACKACHKVPARWMGLPTACADCHADPHRPTLGNRCEACHTDVRFSKAELFRHDKARFTLVGKHSTVACAACHTATGSKGRYRGLAFAACADCHREPKAGHAQLRDCKECHDNESWRKVGRGSALAFHERTRLPLLGRHADVACEKCHTHATKPAGDGNVRYGPLEPACSACHRDPHQQRFGGDCRACHGFVDFGRLPRAPWTHDRTRYPLRGRHEPVACGRCHAPAATYRAKFLARDGDRCTDCHSDPHGGPMASVAAGDRCESCHAVQGFAPAAYGQAEHARARFVLAGAHRVVACSGCHPPDPRQAPGSVPPAPRRGDGVRWLPPGSPRRTVCASRPSARLRRLPRRPPIRAR
ncbi:MAG: hypothetical protein FJ100_20685 [Deltaproteobacteria bacterium]|nr:hypothetical protein [Deltaproteobacteria bacterium]